MSAAAEVDPWGAVPMKAAPEVRVPFGDLASQTMPLDWAENMLRGWRQRDPEGFGYALAEVATGVAPRAPSKRAGRRGDQDGGH